MGAALLRTSRFLDDYREIVTRIADANPDAADRFCDAVESSLALLSRNPEAGRLAGFPSVREVRRWGIPGFRNYIVFYHPRPDGLLLVRLLHGARELPPLVRSE